MTTAETREAGRKKPTQKLDGAIPNPGPAEPELEPFEIAARAAAETAAATTATSATAGPDVFELALAAAHQGNPVTALPPAPKKITLRKNIQGWWKACPNFPIVEGLAVFWDPTPDSDLPPQLLLPDVAAQMFGDPALRPTVLALVATRAGALIAFAFPGADPFTGRMHPANEAKLEAVQHSTANDTWACMEWDKMSREYVKRYSAAIKMPVVWPEDLRPAAILKSAFGDNVIAALDHPILVRHRGEA